MNTLNQPVRRRRQSGFTIIELLIATLVFAMVLILITLGVLSFTRSFFKGLNQSKTQNTARAIVEQIAQSVQFGGGQINGALTVTNDVRGICVGNQRYSYRKGVQLTEAAPGPNQAQRVLVVDEPGNCSSGAAHDLTAGLPPGGRELLTPGMRLAKLAVTQQPGAPNVYTVSVRVVYGDNDLLCSPSTSDCDSTTTTNLANDDLSCRIGFSGAQFCAVSELSTTVVRRINQSP